MPEYRAANRRLAEQAHERHVQAAWDCLHTDRQQARRHLRLAKGWKRAALAWGR